MTGNTDARTAPPPSPHVLDRRTLLAWTLGTATAGALLGARADLTAGAAAQTLGPMPGVALPQGMRVVVTGHDAEGQSYIVRDERVTTDAAFPNLFRTTGDDAFGPGPEPEPRTLYPTDSPRLEPDLGGANFHFVALPPTTADSPPGGTGRRRST